MNLKAFTYIIPITIVVAVVGVGIYFVLNQPKLPVPEIPEYGEITVSGEITCLPKKGSGPQTMECAIGLKGLDGLYYGLKNLFEYDPDYKFSVTGLDVEVSGIFIPEEVSGPDAVKYDVVGAIDITSIKEIADPNPIPKPEGEEILLKEGQRESSFLLEKIYPDYVSGLNFWEYPIATDEGHEVTLRIGEMVSNGCTITLTLTGLEGGVATFIKKTDFSRPCPICLAGTTLIDTPLGSMPVKDLQVGMSVWTADKVGHRIPGVITETSKVPVPETHRMVDLILDDGRELFVSPGHPIVDGRTVGDLTKGDFYDGARVVTVERVIYNDIATYDILPSGETGFYWANGIIMNSTLH